MTITSVHLVENDHICVISIYIYIVGGGAAWVKRRYSSVIFVSNIRGLLLWSSLMVVRESFREFLAENDGSAWWS